jgi:hypothetical protein
MVCEKQKYEKQGKFPEQEKNRGGGRDTHSRSTVFHFFSLLAYWQEKKNARTQT